MCHLKKLLVVATSMVLPVVTVIESASINDKYKQLCFMYPFQHADRSRKVIVMEKCYKICPPSVELNNYCSFNCQEYLSMCPLDGLYEVTDDGKSSPTPKSWTITLPVWSMALIAIGVIALAVIVVVVCCVSYWKKEKEERERRERRQVQEAVPMLPLVNDREQQSTADTDTASKHPAHDPSLSSPTSNVSHFVGGAIHDGVSTEVNDVNLSGSFCANCQGRQVHCSMCQAVNGVIDLKITG